MASWLALTVPAIADARPGDLDPTFDGDGVQTVGRENVSALGDQIAVLSDGHIVAAGSMFAPSQSRTLGIVTRLMPDGSPDRSFGTDQGVLYSAFGYSSATITALAVLPDGRMVVGGSSGAGSSAGGGAAGGSYVARLLPDGTLDPTFDGDGVVELTAPYWIAGLLPQPGGALVVAGGRLTAQGSAAFVRLDPAGAPDSSFSEDGVEPIPESAGAHVNRVISDREGRFLSVGATSYPDCPRLVVARFLPADGRLDPSFSANGVQEIRPTWAGGCSIAALGLAEAPDGGIYAHGSFFTVEIVASGPSTSLVAKLDDGGELDPGFGTGGVLEAGPRALFPERTGDVTLAGTASVKDAAGRQDLLTLQRYHADGTDDPAFENDSRPALNVSSQQDIILGLAEQPNGQLVGVGGSAGTLAVIRLRQDASPADADADADGILDPDDRCPGAHALGRHGCALDQRRLKLRVGGIPGTRRPSKGLRRGVIVALSSARPDCRTGPVRVFRKRTGADELLGEARYSSKVQVPRDSFAFVKPISNRRGRFYADVPRYLAPSTGICARGLSAAVRFGD